MIFGRNDQIFMSTTASGTVKSVLHVYNRLVLLPSAGLIADSLG